ncbi:hypothetical protein DsansV1_C18g0150101 [Dioscorea sansibarensis]
MYRDSRSDIYLGSKAKKSSKLEGIWPPWHPFEPLQNSGKQKKFSVTYNCMFTSLWFILFNPDQGANPFADDRLCDVSRFIYIENNNCSDNNH